MCPSLVTGVARSTQNCRNNTGDASFKISLLKNADNYIEMILTAAFENDTARVKM